MYPTKNEERIIAIETTRKAPDTSGFPNIPLIVGCSAQSTRETIKLCHQASAAGAAYALVLAASYYNALALVFFIRFDSPFIS
ncbi:hypothetical protein EMCG_09034 [[Emmonsia] crescens]|uniref:Uncharacterized protein n=1 Tax=[Emmonsia] crescens TaxID=73230 RepID=A0A0G2I3Y3_9EURO|nr:hypothetical protein EMCG_09034 [Emmonsia crescens UAMH 3008]